MYRTLLILLLFILLFLDSNKLQAKDISKSDIVIGEKILLKSSLLKENRELLIYTPSDYNPNEKYQVIYLLDGQYYFIPTIGIVNSLVASGSMPNSIIVAIITSIRVRDYLPPIKNQPLSPQQEWIQTKFPRFGGTNNFILFLETELFPYIEKNYSTLPNRTLIGHSNGGVFGLHALLNYPHIFTNYLITSPAPWWGNEEIDTLFSQLEQREPQIAHNVFLTVANEGGRYFQHAMRIAANFSSNSSKIFTWHFKHLQNKTHQTTIYPSIHQGLSTLYKDFYFDHSSTTTKYARLTDLVEYYDNLSKKYQFKVKIPIQAFVELADLQLVANNEPDAFDTLNYFVKSYPELSYAHQNIAHAYIRTEQYSLAKKSFEKALNLAKKQKNISYTVKDYLKDMIKAAEAKLN
jgi:predicted alpha/beta superfamily hydrolase